MSSPFQRIAILGPGLLGGSIAMACRARLPEVRLQVWGRREEALRAVAEQQLAEATSTDVGEVVRGAELVILCVPVEHMGKLAGEMVGHLEAEAIVTDVGSVKTMVLEQVGPVVRRRAHFVGSHPMAGSEQAGFEAARADLFEGASCLVIPDEGEDKSHKSYRTYVEKVARFWESLGCQVTEMSAREHDAAVAWVSHLPHLLAAVLVNTVADCAPGALPLCGPGFRDTTRVAAGPPDMWTGIFSLNRTALRDSTEAMIEKLREFATLLDGFDESGIHERLRTAKLGRDRLKNY